MNSQLHQPLVSVLMPIYNAANYLAESLGSIVYQTYQNLEIILVDDGCTDISMDIVHSFNDSRIVTIKNHHNIGLAASLNIAIERASGELLARMDADDIAHRDRIARQVSFMGAHSEIDVVGSAMQYMGESKYLNHFPKNHIACKSFLIFNVCFGHPSVMLRRSVFNSPANFYNPVYLQYSEEYDLWCRLVDEYQFYNMDDVLMNYRTYPVILKSDAEAQRRKNSAEIRKKYLTKHLGQFSDEDWELHRIAALLERCKSVNDLYQIDSWFKKILDLNSETQSFDESVLRVQLAQRYFEVCYAHPNFGAKSMQIYFKSSWSDVYKVSKKNRVKYFVKQIINHK